MRTRDLSPEVRAFIEANSIPARREPAGGRAAATVVPGRWVLTIPGWTPVSDNKLSGVHRMTKHKLKKADAEVIRAEAVAQGIPKALLRRRVSVRVQVPNMAHAPDSGNVNKSLRDALVTAGLLVNDNAAWAVFTEPVIERGKKCTVIEIEDLP